MRPRTLVTLLAFVAAAPVAAQGMPAPRPRSPSDTIQRDTTRPRMPRDSTRDTTRRTPPDTGTTKPMAIVDFRRAGRSAPLLVPVAR